MTCAPTRTQVIVDEAIALDRKHDFQFWLPPALAIQGHLLSERGEVTAGIVQIRAGLTQLKASSKTSTSRTYLPCLLKLKPRQALVSKVLPH